MRYMNSPQAASYEQFLNSFFNWVHRDRDVFEQCSQTWFNYIVARDSYYEGRPINEVRDDYRRTYFNKYSNKWVF